MVQDIPKWKVYQLECEQLTQKLGKSPATRLLWHGTSQTHPDVIINSQEGFDMRFGNPGAMWGKACYFADNASYSMSYAFQTPQG